MNENEVMIFNERIDCEKKLMKYLPDDVRNLISEYNKTHGSILNYEADGVTVYLKTGANLDVTA